MTNVRLRHAIRRLSEDERRELTRAYKHKHIASSKYKASAGNPDSHNPQAIPSRLELVVGIQEGIPHRELANQLSALEDYSLAIIWMGIKSTGTTIPRKVDRAVTNRELLCLYAMRGAFLDGRIPARIESATNDELYTLTMKYIEGGHKYIKTKQPEINWKPNGTTESIPVTISPRANAVFYNFLGNPAP